MKLSNRRVLELNAIMRALVAVEAKNPFKLSGLTRLAIARNAKRLAEGAATLQEVSRGLVAQHGVAGKKEAEAPEEWKALNAEWGKTLEAISDVSVSPIKASAMNLDDNGIPVELLIAADDLIIDDLDPDAPKAEPSQNVVPIAAGKA